MKFRNKKKKKMIDWAKDLFPICRSITGNGTLETLNYLKKINNNLKVVSFKTGTKVFDWKIPKEWNIKDAYIKHESGKKFSEFSKSNINILNYSEPINRFISKKELLNHIFTLPEKPKAVPYVTSYYKKNWGFCMSEYQKKRLPVGKYKAYINSSLKNGKLNLGEALIKGKSNKEIFFSTIICHPSLANNELSGPVLSSALLKYVNSIKKTKFTYRFVFVPETIGSIAYLSKNLKKMKKNMIAGFTLSCVGDEKNFSHIKSIYGNCLSDVALSASLIGYKKVKNYGFLKRGTDERQYYSPGVDLPVCGFCRTRYGDYPEYHTNLDNLNVISQKGLDGSFAVIKNIIDAFETCLYPKYKILCEPQLSRRGLYPTISNFPFGFHQKSNSDVAASNIKARKDILACANGERNIFEIAKLIDLPLQKTVEQLKILKDKKLIQHI